MKVVDLSPEYEMTYCQCLEEYSDDVREAETCKTAWFTRMKDRGLRVKIALDDAGTVGGMIHYVPIERVAVEGSSLYYMYCIWVHGHNLGRGNFQKKGMGTALLRAAEEDVRSLGGKGFVVWGMSLPIFMRASWFRRHGYRRVDRDGILELLWKPFTDDAVAPKLIRQKMRPHGEPDKVVVTCFMSGWCTAQDATYERARRAAAALGDRVVFRGIDTLDRDVAAGWGISDALFIDDREVRTGPPPSYDTIKAAIEKRLRSRHLAAR